MFLPVSIIVYMEAAGTDKMPEDLLRLVVRNEWILTTEGAEDTAVFVSAAHF